MSDEATGESGCVLIVVFMIALSISLGVSPENGGSPTVSSYNRTPTAQ